MRIAELLLQGAGGEPVDFARTIVSHGVAELPPNQVARLDEDLSGFYRTVCEDAELAWCAEGAGRMLRAPTVFEDVVKTMCTVIQTPRSIVTVAPGKGGLGTFAPWLDFAGNGVRGQLVAARPSRRLGLDLFVSQAEGRVH